MAVLAAITLACGCSREEDAGSSAQAVVSGAPPAADARKPLAARGLAAPADQAGSLARPFVPSYCPDSPEIPTLARVYASEKPSLSGCCHILLYYGLGPTDLPSFPRGALALQALTDERTAIATFGKSPFVRTRHGLRYLLSQDPVFHSDVGEAHRDQCLVVYAALGLPLTTPVTLEGRSGSLADLLSESVANFTPDQKELAWTALAYASYLPPRKEWVNRFAERTSFSQLTSRLLQRDLNAESCAGSHLLQALVQIDLADHACQILDSATRQRLDAYLTQTLQELVRRQREDGSWDWQWSDGLKEPASLPPLVRRFLVTGHLGELLLSLDARRRLPEPVGAHAAEWLRNSLSSTDIRRDGFWICPFTHAARVVSAFSSHRAK